jgi:hypothetical protein
MPVMVETPKKELMHLIEFMTNEKVIPTIV